MIHVIPVCVFFLAATGSQLGYSVRNRKEEILWIMLVATCSVTSGLGRCNLKGTVTASSLVGFLCPIKEKATDFMEPPELSLNAALTKTLEEFLTFNSPRKIRHLEELHVF